MTRRGLEGWRQFNGGNLVSPDGSAVVEAQANAPVARVWISLEGDRGGLVSADIPHEALAAYLESNGYEVRRIEP
jgi:hypothetical protein